MPATTRARLLRWLLALLVVGAFAALLLWPKATLVDTARADRGPVREVVEADPPRRLVRSSVTTSTSIEPPARQASTASTTGR